jgi:hypothetical protein
MMERVESETWKRKQPVSGPSDPSPEGAALGLRSPKGAGVGPRRCCLVSKKVESGKSTPQARGLTGFSFHFELCTFHLRLLPLHKRRFNVQNVRTSKSGQAAGGLV